MAALKESSANSRGLTIKDNEIYFEDILITRISKKITSAKRFPDNQHIIYQAENELWIIGNDGFNVRKIFTLPTDAPTQFNYRENGKRLVYRQTLLVTPLLLIARL